MRTAKFVQKFFTKSQAHEHACYLRRKAKVENVLLAGVEVINAYELYKTNSWFKKSPFKHLGMPSVDSYIVVVHYEANVCEPVQAKVVKNKIKNAVHKGTVRSLFFIVRLTEKQLKKVKMLKLTPANTLSKTVGVKYVHLTSYVSGRQNNTIEFRLRHMDYRLAA